MIFGISCNLHKLTLCKQVVITAFFYTFALPLKTLNKAYSSTLLPAVFRENIFSSVLLITIQKALVNQSCQVRCFPLFLDYLSDNSQRGQNFILERVDFLQHDFYRGLNIFLVPLKVFTKNTPQGRIYMLKNLRRT